MAPLLELKNLSTHYVSQRGTRVVKAVDSVSLALEAGETLGIVGESGSGKTTLGMALLGLQPLASGSVAIAGQRVDAADREQLRAMRRQMQIDEFSAAYEWDGAILRFSDAAKDVRYEVRIGARKGAPVKTATPS